MYIGTGYMELAQCLSSTSTSRITSPQQTPYSDSKAEPAKAKGVAMPKYQSIPGETIDETVGASPTAYCRMTTDRVTSSRGESPSR